MNKIRLVEKIELMLYQDGTDGYNDVATKIANFVSNNYRRRVHGQIPVCSGNKAGSRRRKGKKHVGLSKDHS